MTVIAGSGSYLPDTIVDNAAFSDPRFRLRGGSKQRHHADEESAVQMSVAAANAALLDAGIAAADIDLIISYSGMPDFLYPKDTNLLVSELGTTQAAAWTLDTACASCISALSAADAMLAAGRAEHVLVVQTMHWVNRGIDRDTTDYSSLGDGAAALVVSNSDEPALLGAVERTDPDGFDFVQLRSPFATDQRENIEFSTDPKYRGYFGATVLEVVRDVFEQSGLGADDIDWFVPHQVGPTLLNVWCEQLRIDPAKLVHTFAETGNMSAVNIPHIIDVNRRNGRFQPADKLLLFAPGAGMHLAAMVWQLN